MSDFSPLPKFPYFIFLNGPKGVGKSTLARALQQASPNPELINLYHHALPVYEMAAIISQDYSERLGFESIDPASPLADEFKKKPVLIGLPPIQVAGKLTGREFLIGFNELLHEKLHPETIGYLAANHIQDHAAFSYNCFIFEAVRRPQDITPTLRHFPNERACLLKLHRPGINWENDLGGYITDMLPLYEYEIQLEDGNIQEGINSILNCFRQMERE